jgi:hypothetical protein
MDSTAIYRIRGLDIMYEPHPNFVSPMEENERIWRYIDLAKFISILDKRALYFTRSDRFNDKFEGSYSKFNKENRHIVYKNDERISKLIPEIAKDMRKFVFINSWHINSFESAAMWNIYSRINESIAIQSTFKRLKESFNNNSKKIYIGKVNYADYDAEWIPEDNVLNPFLYKMKSFQHENELRAIYFELPQSQENGKTYLNHALYDGLYIDIDIDRLVETMYISPLAEDWFYDLIKSVINKYDYNFNIKKSNLCGSPVY